MYQQVSGVPADPEREGFGDVNVTLHRSRRWTDFINGCVYERIQSNAPTFRGFEAVKFFAAALKRCTARKVLDNAPQLLSAWLWGYKGGTEALRLRPQTTLATLDWLARYKGGTEALRLR